MRSVGTHLVWECETGGGWQQLRCKAISLCLFPNGADRWRSDDRLYLVLSLALFFCFVELKTHCGGVSRVFGRPGVFSLSSGKQRLYVFIVYDGILRKFLLKNPGILRWISEIFYKKQGNLSFKSQTFSTLKLSKFPIINTFLLANF